MGKQWKTEEQLKLDIFSIYSRYLNEPSPDRRQVYFSQIWAAVISWCAYLNLKIEASEMGMEIFDAVQRLIKSNNTKVPKDETGFFKYLKTTLYRAQDEYFRHHEDSPMHISRGTREKWKKVEEIITRKESKMGKKLTEDERWQYISKWFSIEEYTKLMNLKNTGSLENYMESSSADPQEEYLAKLDLQDLKDALELALKKVQKRSRECYRSLFTAYCIDKLIDFEVLVPLLDGKILEAHRKSGEKPTQYEIYMKYHPETKKTSAEVRASQMSTDFLKKLNTALLEKNQ